MARDGALRGARPVRVALSLAIGFAVATAAAGTSAEAPLRPAARLALAAGVGAGAEGAESEAQAAESASRSGPPGLTDPTVGWVDPLREFHATIGELKQIVKQADLALVSTLQKCREEGKSTNCEASPEVLQARGEVRLVRTVVHRINALKAVATELQRESEETQAAYKNATESLANTKIALGVTQMERDTVDQKLETLHKVDKQWRVEMHSAAQTLLGRKQQRQAATKKVEAAEKKRLKFLVELNAVLEAVAGGNDAVDLTYENAEETLRRANEREVHAKELISKAEKKLDKAYHEPAAPVTQAPPLRGSRAATSDHGPSSVTTGAGMDALSSWGGGSM